MGDCDAGSQQGLTSPRAEDIGSEVAPAFFQNEGAKKSGKKKDGGPFEITVLY
jgi:hypothetical protein